MLNLAGFGRVEHDLFRYAGIPGLRAMLDVELEPFAAAIARAAARLQVEPPSDLIVETSWEQARTIADE